MFVFASFDHLMAARVIPAAASGTAGTTKSTNSEFRIIVTRSVTHLSAFHQGLISDVA
jgi:hypothetical protein